VNFTIASKTYTTNKSISLLEGLYTVTMPSTWMNGTDEYLFRHWEDDSTNPVRVVSLKSNTTITATYGLAQNYTLTVNSVPIVDVNFTIASKTYTTNKSISLLEGLYTVTMPSTWTVGTDQYNFVKWENNSTNPTRVVSLTSNTTITAIYNQSYVKVYVNQTLGYIPGQPSGQTVTVDIIIEVTNITDNSPGGIVGWTIDIQVDPDVLNLTTAIGAEPGYFLWEFANFYSYSAPSLDFSLNATTGFGEITELLLGVPGGAGDYWSGYKLVSFNMTSKSETAYSLIDLIDVYYMTDSKWYPVDEVIDGYYNPVPVLTVESTPIDGINFTIDSTTYTTNTSISLPKEATVTMPLTWTVDTDKYIFRHWEDNSTDPVRTLNLVSNTTITATYGLVQNYTLTVNSEPIAGVNFTIGSTTYLTNTSVSLLEGSYTVTMPSTWIVGADQYNFVKWENNSTNPTRVVSLTSNKTIIATYERVLENYTLTVNSVPIDGIDFTINGTSYTTNKSISLLEGLYTVTMPSTWTVGTDQYNFVKWENNSTNPTRVVSLTSNTTITATYELALTPPVASFIFSPTEPIVGETVTFNASASADADGTIVSYSWDFGDGTTETYVKDVNLTAIATHAYEAAGDYNVTLTVTDDDGLTHTITKTITVKEAPPPGLPSWIYVIIIAVIAIIIIGTAVYYLKIRQKPT
ncbi:hypothetical protein DRO69_03470, partial [Candidatus Bathyarchaeota archaeon]